jgi:hypothetical protein
MNQTPHSDPQSSVDEIRKFWQELGRDTIKGSAAVVEESARQIISVVGVMEGLYFHAITFAELRGKVNDLWSIVVYLSPLIFWLFSMLFSALVFLPRVYDLNIISSESAKKMYEDVGQRKHLFLLTSMFWMVIGGIGLIFALAKYLSGD